MNNNVRCEVDIISMAVALASTLIRSIFVLSNRPTFFQCKLWYWPANCLQGSLLTGLWYFRFSIRLLHSMWPSSTSSQYISLVLLTNHWTADWTKHLTDLVLQDWCFIQIWNLGVKGNSRRIASCCELCRRFCTLDWSSDTSIKNIFNKDILELQKYFLLWNVKFSFILKIFYRLWSHSIKLIRQILDATFTV